jgi:hypothetical protein
MKDKKKGKTRGEQEKGAEGDRIKNINHEPTQRLPEFNSEASLYTTSGEQYHLTKKYAQTSVATSISSASSLLSYLCYYKCMIECSVICSPPRMCLISCPQQCRAQCGLFETLGR